MRFPIMGPTFSTKLATQLLVRRSLMAPITNVIDQFPLLRRPYKKIADPGKVRLGDGFITAEFPP